MDLGGLILLGECNIAEFWFDCLNCGLIDTRLCPLEGSDSLEKISNRIRMRDDPSFNGLRKELISNKQNI